MIRPKARKERESSMQLMQTVSSQVDREFRSMTERMQHIYRWKYDAVMIPRWECSRLQQGVRSSQCIGLAIEVLEDY